MAIKTFLYLSLCIGLLAVIGGVYFTKRPEMLKAFKETFIDLGQKVKLLFGYDGSSQKKTSSEVSKVFTLEELKHLKGGPGSKGLCVAVLGKVFDVSAGKKHYGPGGGYEFFSGRDGTRAFVTGDFTEKGLTDDLSGFTPSQGLEVKSWVDFYEKQYIYVGKLQGRYYNKDGKPTEELARVEALIAKGEEEKSQDQEIKNKYPPCNSEWTQQKGGRVWCSNRSGGIERDWVGVPRLFFKPGSTQSRCACIRTTGPPSDNLEAKDHQNRGDLDNPNLKEYKDCDPTSPSCRLPKT
ncbi:neuferricin-like [Ptychodera flava]|uniref:neuferricin-like n=1 Tax=Ptychodera flava TaxID=63121 RepID=UPI003969CA66